MHPTAEHSYRDVIDRAAGLHPRATQRAIGPSEIGNPCNRYLLHRLAGTPKPPRHTSWKAALGTATHTQLAEWFDHANPVGGNLDDLEWLTDWPVTVGNIDGTPITGELDLYHLPTGTVIDHKLVSTKQLGKYRATGPLQQYIIQANLYAKGINDAGELPPATRIAISHLPRDSELSKAWWWEDDYRPDIAEQALNRLATLAAELHHKGLTDALATHPTCDSIWCDWCAPLNYTPERHTLHQPGRGLTKKQATTHAHTIGSHLTHGTTNSRPLPSTPQPARR